MHTHLHHLATADQKGFPVGVSVHVAPLGAPRGESLTNVPSHGNTTDGPRGFLVGVAVHVAPFAAPRDNSITNLRYVAVWGINYSADGHSTCKKNNCISIFYFDCGCIVWF